MSMFISNVKSLFEMKEIPLDVPQIKGRNSLVNCTPISDVSDLNDIGNGVFYVSVVLVALMGIFGTLANGLVLYISRKNNDFGGFQEVNSVVKHLATSDFLFGVLGCPLTIVWWYWGE